MESPTIRRLSRLSFGRGRSVCSQPSPTGRPASSKYPSCPACAMPRRGMAAARSTPSRARAANSPSDSPVAVRMRVRLSVEGQRGRGGSPGPNRLDGLKLVASRPARLASAETLSPSCRARLSIAFQSWAWERGMGSAAAHIGLSRGHLRNEYPGPQSGKAYSRPAARRSCHAQKVPMAMERRMPVLARLMTA